MSTGASTTNLALVFIKPVSNIPSVERLVLQNLENNGIRVVSQGVAFAEDIDKKGIIDRHYGSIARIAMKQTAAEMAITAEGESKFAAAFDESWKDAAAAGRIFNAAEATASKFGGNEDMMTAAWKSPVKSAKIGPGFYAAQIKSNNNNNSEAEQQEPFYIINGFYVSMRHKFTAPGSSVRWFVVQWPETELAWSEFRSKVIGATNPANAATESIRAQVLKQWKELGLATQPDGSDNAVHASASPLEGLAERCIWLNGTVAQDRCGRALLDAGVDALMVSDWLMNPNITVKGEQKPVFDVLEDCDTSYVVSFMADYARVHGTGRAAGGAAAGGPASKRSAGRNYALVVIKPAANTSDVQAFITTKLRSAGVVVKASADVVASKIAEDRIVEHHFADLAHFAGASKQEGSSSAALVRPKLDQNERALFRSAFARDYEEALDLGLVATAYEAMERLNFCSADALLNKWSTGTRQRFSPSLVIGHISDASLPQEELFVLNGFFPSLEECFVGDKKENNSNSNSSSKNKNKKKTRILHVEWDESKLSWNEWLSDVIGNVDPVRARPGSLRAQLYAQWRSLGLESPPDVLNNGVSCSGSPVEAMKQRLVWFGGRVQEDVFGALALACGVPEQALHGWLDGSGGGGMSLAGIRGWDSSKVIRTMAGQRVSSALSDAERKYLEEKGTTLAAASPARGSSSSASGASPSPASPGSKLSRSAADLLGGVVNDLEEHEENSASRARPQHQQQRRRAGSPSAAAILTPRRRAAIHQHQHGGAVALAAQGSSSPSASVGVFGDLKLDGVDLAPPRPGNALSSPRKKRNPATGTQFGLQTYSEKYGKDVERQRKLEELLHHDLTDTDLRDATLRQYFALFDSGAAKDGFIDREEFKLVFRQMESFGRTPSVEETDALFRRFDYNDDQKLSFEEFALLMAHRLQY